ncbi:MAG TPA: 6-aminohexanoate hydrolase [Rhodobacteraceae bacterium]|nr:6-aminohexanoate hydrolase [Paracoccaceae bacterium]
MRTFGKWLGRAALALLLAAVVVGVWKREEITRLWAVNTLFEPDKIVANFSDMGGAFLTVPVPRGDGPASPLPQGPEMTLPEGAEDWIEARAVTSLLVLEGGEIRHESYHLGTEAEDRRISWSVAKSYLSALLGVLLEEGAIASIDDPVTDYAPALEGSAYEGATIRNVLNMASGVTFDEDYFDPDSDINRMGRAIALGGTLDDFTASFTETFAAPGETWQYVSIDTHVLGMVIRGATGRPVAELLSEKIVQPLGLERHGSYITDGAGAAFVLGGLNFTTRDFARFALMIEQDGRFGGEQIVPADWIAASTAPSAPTEPGNIGYGFQWWIPVGAEAGEFLARGVYGQYLYIDQARDVVIVATGADRGFRDAGVHAGNVEMFRKIARSL